MKLTCTVFVRNDIVHIIPPRCGTKSFIAHFFGSPFAKDRVAPEWENTGKPFSVDPSTLEGFLQEATDKGIPIVLNLREPMSRAYSGLTMYMLWGDKNIDHVVPFLTELPYKYVTHIIPFDVLQNYVDNYVTQLEPTIKDLPREVEVLDRWDYTKEIEIYQELSKLPVMSPKEYFELMALDK
jgi:hypothetical protein